MNGTRAIVAFLACVCLLPRISAAQAISATKVLGRYQQTVWQDQDGLPQNSVYTLLRARDGYMWLGTVEGLIRFDGVRFTTFDSSNTPGLPISDVRALAEDREGTLWIGTEGGGLVRRSGETFTEVGLSSRRVQALYVDSAGTLWVGTVDRGLARFRDGRFIEYMTRDGLPDDEVLSIAEDHAGVLWIGTRSGLARFDGEGFIAYGLADGIPPNGVYTLYVDRRGELWVGARRGLCRFVNGRCLDLGIPAAIREVVVRAIHEDRVGRLWIGTADRGLYRVEGSRVEIYGSQDGLPVDAVDSIYEDPDGDLWIGLDGGGLCRLREGSIKVYTTQDGLPNDVIRAVYEDTRHQLWVGTAAGLARFADGAFTPVRDAVGPEYNVTILAEDTGGHIWFRSRDALHRRGGDGVTTFTIADGLPNVVIRAILADRQGTVWVGTLTGLAAFREGRFSVYSTKDGLASNDVRALYEDRGGALWVGTSDGGMSRFANGRFTTWTTSDGLSNNHVISFYEDRSGALWIGTHGGGLSRFKNNEFATIGVKQGLYDNLAHQLIADDEEAADGGSLWMTSNKGIYRAGLRELNEVADGRRASVASYAYGVSDGMLTRECNGASPGGWKTADGSLWFPTMKGLATIDPNRRNTDPPRVALERLTVDGVAVATQGPVRMRPEDTNIEIDYTGLSWARPDHIRFKYQLIGLDRNWVDAGTRRRAQYAHLPPGDYTFKVIADNGDGVWNLEGQALHIVVLPPFYRTWWFVTLAGASAVCLLAFGYVHRVRHLRGAEVAQRAFSRQLMVSQEGERKRIAAELHDGLGQQLVIIRNLALMLREPFGDGMRERIDQISNASSQALNEVRAISQNLRPYYLDRFGLTKSLEALVSTAEAASTIAFTTDIDNIDDVFPKDVQINVYRAVQESVNNVLKHSNATAASVSVRRSASQVQIVIEDNGIGFAVEAETGRTGRVGFGLVGITERVKLVGGRAQFDASPGRGTRVSLTFDGHGISGDR